MVPQWLGFGAFTATGQDQSLVLRTVHKWCDQKKKKKKASQPMFG